jgi:CheY-like chemotaxis protein
MANHAPYIAFADDDADDQEMLADRFLQRHPDVVFKFFKDGGEIGRYLEYCPTMELPSLLILDYKMPIHTGADILKALYKDVRYSGMHKVVWSTSGNKEYVTQCLKYGAEKYFTKPDNINGLDAIIDQLSRFFPGAPAGQE